MVSLQTINKRFNAVMPFVTPIGVVIGLLLGHSLDSYRYLGTYFFAFITFVGALGVSYRQFAQIARRLRVVLLVLVCAHIVLPVLVALLGRLAFPQEPDIVTGFILLSSIPIAVTAFIWSNIYEGDAALALSLIILDTLLSPLLTPLTVRLLSNTTVVIDSGGIMTSLLVMIVVPSLLGMLCTQFVPKTAKRAVLYLSPLTKVLLIVVVVLHVGALAGSLAFTWVYVPLILMNLLVIALGFLIVYLLGRFVLKVDRASLVSMTFTGGMRNISAALVLATTYFSPLTALPVILGILFQQTFVGFLGGVLFARKKKD
ncbi:MAG: bile acid:sodium symporter family protein [Sphaerochaeta sp.]